MPLFQDGKDTSGLCRHALACTPSDKLENFEDIDETPNAKFCEHSKTCVVLVFDENIGKWIASANSHLQ